MERIRERKSGFLFGRVGPRVQTGRENPWREEATRSSSSTGLPTPDRTGVAADDWRGTR